MFGEGISKMSELLDVGVKLGIVQKSGAWFNYGDVRIGRNVLIGPYCSLPAGNHKFDPATQSFATKRDAAKPIVIGDGSWLASGCTVTGGVTVGRCNLICANSVVTHDTPDYAIMAGTPARRIGEIDPESGEYRYWK